MILTNLNLSTVEHIQSHLVELEQIREKENNPSIKAQVQKLIDLMNSLKNNYDSGNCEFYTNEIYRQNRKSVLDSSAISAVTTSSDPQEKLDESNSLSVEEVTFESLGDALFSHLKPRQLLNFNQLSKALRNVSNQRKYWLTMLNTHFPYVNISTSKYPNDPKALFTSKFEELKAKLKYKHPESDLMEPYRDVKEIEGLPLTPELKQSLYIHAAANGDAGAMDKLNNDERIDALMEAISNQYLKGLKVILTYPGVCFTDKQLEAAVTIASSDGLYHITKALMEHAPLIYTKKNTLVSTTRIGADKLMYAASTGNADALYKSMEAGISPNGDRDQALRPLGRAVNYGHENIVRALAKAGANMNETPGLLGQNCPLLTAISTNNTKMAKVLVDLGADVNAYSCIIETLLERSNPEMFAVVFDRIKNKDQIIDHVIKSKMENIFIWLTQNVANLGLENYDSYGSSRFDYIMREGTPAMQSALIETKPNWSIYNPIRGSTRFMNALHFLSDEQCAQILKQNPDLDLPQKNGSTLLMRAAFNNKKELVKMFLAHTPRPNLLIKDDFGFTALKLAEKEGYGDITQMLTTAMQMDKDGPQEMMDIETSFTAEVAKRKRQKI